MCFVSEQMNSLELQIWSMLDSKALSTSRITLSPNLSSTNLCNVAHYSIPLTTGHLVLYLCDCFSIRHHLIFVQTVDQILSDRS